MNDTLEFLSYLISGLGVIGIWVVGTRRRLGWLLGALSQSCLITYGITVGDWGFVLLPPFYIAAQVFHMVRWRHEGWGKLQPPRKVTARASDTIMMPAVTTNGHGSALAATRMMPLAETVRNARLSAAHAPRVVLLKCPGCDEKFSPTALVFHQQLVRHPVWTMMGREQLDTDAVGRPLAVD